MQNPKFNKNKIGKLFIDVTQSCRSSNNSGIQVVTRNLFRKINSKCKTVPMIWDDRLCRYSLLSRRELKNLENPFHAVYSPKERPNKEENPFYKEILRSILRIGRTIRLDRCSVDENLIFFPEVFRDRRVNKLHNFIHSPIKSSAIFHDANVLREPQNTPASRLKNFEKYLFFISKVDKISCVSNESMKSFKKFRTERNKLQKIGVHYWPVETPVSNKPSEPIDPPHILCVSTLAYNKNHLTLLQAFENLWQEGLRFEVDLVGQSDPSWTPRVIESMKQLLQKKRPIRWLKHIDQETLEEKYSSCSFTVYPSLYEGFGLPILESLIRGKPCICGSNGALGEVSRGGGCLNVSDQLDSRQLAKAIAKLLQDSNILNRLKQEASRRDFGTWEKYTNELLDFFFMNN